MTSKKTQKNAQFHWKNILFLLVLLLLSTSVVSIIFVDFNTAENQIKPKVRAISGLMQLGQLQQISTLTIGPITHYNLTYISPNSTQISSSAFQLFWLQPTITCVSVNTESPC